jgi:hypothetical protein
MANKHRMLSNRIIHSASFLRMPIDSQLLYINLVTSADDDGIVEAFQVMRMLGSNEDNLKLLEAKEYVKILDMNLVTFIIDWKEHNSIRADRLTPSIYRSMLLNEVPNATLKLPLPRVDVMDNSRRIGDGQMMDSPRTDNGTSQGKVSKGKVSKGNNTPSNPAFDAFWIQYPRKVGKYPCTRAWEKIHPEGELLTKIMDSLEKHKKSIGWMKDSGRFIPHPTTWLNQKRWDDEVELYVNKTITLS